MIYAYILICILFALMIVEAIHTRHGIKSISLKIHVNGTRGKSTITKYISTALRSSDIKTVGKVTGEIPGLIQPDGHLIPIRRLGPARVNEQFRVIRKAAKTKAEALVLECMSINPTLQKIESLFYKPDIYVISNIRDDHREKVGARKKQRVEYACQAIPVNCILVSNDLENLTAIRLEAEKKNCRLLIPEKLGKKLVNDLPYGVFAANIEVAVEVAVLAGIDRDVALKSILDSISDDESCLIQFQIKKTNAVFLNAFSVNDTDSATDFLTYWSDKLDIHKNLAFIFNTRSDRPLRTKLFSEWIEKMHNQCRFVIITGDHKEWAYRNLKYLNPGVEIRKLKSNQINEILNIIDKEYPGTELIIGIGNIMSEGYKILEKFKNAS
ncbi:MAG: poly-gamma-glutamate synthase PgsB [Bacteroidota bacterium]|nr:poly-gamma-glutamate synthase PgsB [Bacteroidota bacterium]